jgi:uncharacterized protein (UPF0305 family)
MNLDTFMHDMNTIMFLMIMLWHVVWFMQDHVKDKSIRCYMTSLRHEIEQVKNMIPMTILGFP